MNNRNGGWTKIEMPTAYIRLDEDGKTILVEQHEDDGNEEELEQIRGVISMAVDNRLAEEVGVAMELIEQRLAEQIDEYLGDYVVPELETQLQEQNADVEMMIVKLVNLLNVNTREKWIADVAADARKRASDQGEYRGADGVPEEEGETNRNSLKPNSGRSYGVQGVRESVVDANLELRDAMLMKAKAQKQQYHDSILEYVEKLEGRSKGVLRG